MKPEKYYVILILLVLFFDIIGAHLYSKITMLILMIVIINNLESNNKIYDNIELSDDIEL
jgi:hypothetical protein